MSEHTAAILHGLEREVLSLEERITQVFELHLRSAQSEGRVLEGHIIALVKDLIMTTANELQGKINSAVDKFSQVEADVRDLVAKAGSTAPAPAGGPTISQDQLDAMGTAVDGLSARMDGLVQEVVHGTPSSTPPVTATPSAEPPTTPPPGTPVTDSPAPTAPAGSPSATGTPAPAPGA